MNIYQVLLIRVQVDRQAGPLLFAEGFRRYSDILLEIFSEETLGREMEFLRDFFNRLVGVDKFLLC